MENLKSNALSKDKVLSVFCLIVFVLFFIFSCMYKSLHFGAILVGTFGVIIYPVLFILSFFCFARFLGFSYRRNIKATIYFLLFVYSILAVIHSIKTFSVLNDVASKLTFIKYLSYSYNHLTLLGSFGSLICGLITFISEGIGSIVLFIILATTFLALFIDYELYGRYQPKKKKLNKNKFVTVSNATEIEKNEDYPKYKKDDVVAEITANVGDNAQEDVHHKYSDSDIAHEIVDSKSYGGEDFSNEDFSSIYGQSYYGVSPVSFEEFKNNSNFENDVAGQQENQFSNDVYQEPQYPDIYDENEQRRQFIRDTFSSYSHGQEAFETSSNNSETENNQRQQNIDDFVSPYASIDNYYSNNHQNYIGNNNSSDYQSSNSNNYQDNTSNNYQNDGINYQDNSSIKQNNNYTGNSNFDNNSENGDNQYDMSNLYINYNDNDPYSFTPGQNTFTQQTDDNGNLSVSDKISEILGNDLSKDDLTSQTNQDNNTFDYKNINSNSKYDSGDTENDSLSRDIFGGYGNDNFYESGFDNSSLFESSTSALNDSDFKTEGFRSNNTENDKNSDEDIAKNVSDDYNSNFDNKKETTNSYNKNELSFLYDAIKNDNENLDDSNSNNKVENNNSSNNADKIKIPSKEPQKKNNNCYNMGMSGIRYNPPPSTLLNPVIIVEENHDEEQQRKVKGLEETLKAFNLPVTVQDIVRGPKITRFYLSVPLGVSIKRIPNYELDIKKTLEAKTINILAPIPGSQFVGVELENDTFTNVYFRELIESHEFQDCTDPLPIVIGKDISGEIIVKSLVKMTHLLIAGQTGSGKSVFIHSFILSLIFKYSPDDLRLVLIDPKKVEFNRYNGLPHLITPEVVSGTEKAINAMKWCVDEMDRRYELMKNSGYSYVIAYNNSELVKSGHRPKFPYIVIIVDEFAEIILANKKDAENCIQRLSQLARACGIHLVLATQRPSVDVISGIIKNNIPSRIAFSLQSSFDSKTILNTVGAEKLLGQGDMLFSPCGTSVVSRLQAPICTDEEIQRVIDYDKNNNMSNFDEEVVKTLDNMQRENRQNSATIEGEDVINSSDTDIYLKIALKTFIQRGEASGSYLQRKLKIGYARAARIVDQLENKGYISPPSGGKMRQVLITPEQFKLEFGEDVEIGTNNFDD